MTDDKDRLSHIALRLDQICSDGMGTCRFTSRENIVGDYNWMTEEIRKLREDLGLVQLSLEEHDEVAICRIREAYEKAAQVAISLWERTPHLIADAIRKLAEERQT